MSHLIFSGSDILTYRNIFCLANFGVKPHQRHADFYTKVIVKNWADFETFLFSLLDIQKSFLTIRNIKTQPKKANYKNWGMALNGQTTVQFCICVHWFGDMCLKKKQENYQVFRYAWHTILTAFLCSNGFFLQFQRWHCTVVWPFWAMPQFL